ncbi:hypothetical protein C8J57DRAFT_1490499 [Mycena rebaudengoi]|nr:hypothetical protein C8J57DRAFT_1490499 [Mycena rebaudengoi]
MDWDQYSLKAINGAAEWYFRRNKFESRMLSNIDDFGIVLESEDSADNSSEQGSLTEDNESDYEEYRRKKRQRAKKRRGDKKEAAKDKQKFGGTEEEIASMIRKLNAMKIDDPEYAPVYYRVMVLDQTGTASKCVKAPVLEETLARRPSRGYAVASPATTSSLAAAPPEHVTYPNNIPLGTTTMPPPNTNISLSFAASPSPPPETHEPIRYLARPVTVPQIMANEPLDDRSPEQAVRGAVYGQWRQYHGRVPLSIQPSFMATPQSVYYGATITDAGQTIHSLSNLNGNHIITDPETGSPVLVPGHSFTTIFEVPGRGPWYIEAPYPSEERLQGAIGQYPSAPGSPVARWTIPVAHRAPPPEIAAPVTIAASLASNTTTDSDELEAMAASLFTGTTTSSDELLATPDYPGTPPPTAQSIFSTSPTEPPGSVTPSSQSDSLPDLVDINSEIWKDELAARIETALGDAAQLERAPRFDAGSNVSISNLMRDETRTTGTVCPAWRAPSPLYSDMQAQPCTPSPKTSVRQDNGAAVTIGRNINTEAEKEIRDWISGRIASKAPSVNNLLRERHEELTERLLKNTEKTVSAPIPASRWREGEEELEIRAWRAAELYKSRVNDHTFAVDATPFPVNGNPPTQAPERLRKPYVVSAETQQLLADALAAERETTHADHVAVPFLGSRGRGAVITREHWSSSSEVESTGDSDCGLGDLEPYSHALFYDAFSQPLPRSNPVPPATIARPNTILDSLVTPQPPPVLTAKKPLITFPSGSLFGDHDSVETVHPSIVVKSIISRYVQDAHKMNYT